MGQIANQMALELFFKIKERIKEKKEEKNNHYEIDYCGLENCYDNARRFYTEGELVVLRYLLIATDTDYSFTLDGENIDYSYKNGAFEICFNMPGHNVKLECHSVNTMAVNEHS